MREEIVYFDNVPVIYYIGTNAADNFLTIDMGAPDDYWFHAKNVSSCHVVVKMPEGYEEGINLRSVIKRGALICKQNTSKLKSLQDVEFIYTNVKYVTKTKIPGLVTLTNQKTIIL
jgi:predicted ribosome quality control (RQC) complex YloA/Tae2 family protein